MTWPKLVTRPGSSSVDTISGWGDRVLRSDIRRVACEAVSTLAPVTSTPPTPSCMTSSTKGSLALVTLGSPTTSTSAARSRKDADGTQGVVVGASASGAAAGALGKKKWTGAATIWPGVEPVAAPAAATTVRAASTMVTRTRPVPNVPVPRCTPHATPGQGPLFVGVRSPDGLTDGCG